MDSRIMEDKLYRLERKLLYKELQPLFEVLSSVRYAVVKGEVLSQQIYGVPDRRRSSDIDILIDKKNVKFLEEQLQKLGFEQKLPEDSAKARRNRVLCMAYSHQTPSYHKEKFGFHFNVDVNYDIFWGEYEGQRCSIDEFLSDTVDMEIYGVMQWIVRAKLYTSPDTLLDGMCMCYCTSMNVLLSSYLDSLLYGICFGTYTSQTKRQGEYL